MTYQVFAMYPEGCYLVAESNSDDHVTEHADAVLKAHNIVPCAVARIIRGEHTINAEKFTFDQLVAKYKRGVK